MAAGLMEKVDDLNKGKERKYQVKQNEEIEVINLEEKMEVPRKKLEIQAKSSQIAWDNETKKGKKLLQYKDSRS